MGLQKVSRQEKKVTFEQLPDELLLYLGQYFISSPWNIARLAGVNRKFWHVFSDYTLWMSLLQQRACFCPKVPPSYFFTEISSAAFPVKQTVHALITRQSQADLSPSRFYQVNKKMYHLYGGNLRQNKILHIIREGKIAQLKKLKPQLTARELTTAFGVPAQDILTRAMLLKKEAQQLNPEQANDIQCALDYLAKNIFFLNPKDDADAASYNMKISYLAVRLNQTSLVKKSFHIENNEKLIKLLSTAIIYGGNLEMVKILLSIKSENFDINQVFYLRYPGQFFKKVSTLVTLAAEYQHWDIVAYLIQHHHAAVNFVSPVPGANGQELNQLIYSLLHRIVISGDVVLLKYLVDHYQADLQVRYKGNYSLLHAAAAHGKIDMVDYLLTQNIFDLKRCDHIFSMGEISDCYNILHTAVKNGQLAMVKYLIAQKKMSAIAPSLRFANQPLHIAAATGNFLMVQYLLEYASCNITAINRNGKTPAMLAHELGFPKIYAYLNKRVQLSSKLNALTVDALSQNITQIKSVLISIFAFYEGKNYPSINLGRWGRLFFSQGAFRHHHHTIIAKKIRIALQKLPENATLQNYLDVIEKEKKLLLAQSVSSSGTFYTLLGQIQASLVQLVEKEKTQPRLSSM